MITSIVRFPLPKGTSLELSGFGSQVLPLRRGQTRRRGSTCGKTEAAERQYSPAWKGMIADKFGTAPEITFYNTPVIVDNSAS